MGGSVGLEKTTYEVSENWVARAHLDAQKYRTVYAFSTSAPDKFWEYHGSRIDWIKPYTKVKNTCFDPGKVFIKWFEDGTTNVSTNCIDRQLASRENQTAIIWEEDDPSESKRAPMTKHRMITGFVAVALLATACILLFASEAKAQCMARDVLQNELKLKKAPSASRSQIPVRSAIDVPVWRSITVGTFADFFALSNALDAVGCGIGNPAGEILVRPTFTLSATKTNVDLFLVSATELGFQTDTASLADIYARAQQLGFELAAAEVGPQLRLQYFDQPVGEFLIIGMQPIRTRKDELVILNVANGGAGLILIDQDGSAEAQISVASRFVFARSDKAAPAEGQEAAALVNRWVHAGPP